MKFILRHALLALFACLGSLAALAAGELTVTNITSNANDGIMLTFSQNVKVTHSIFGVKCYNTFDDADANVKSLNASVSTKDNVVTLTAAWCTFVNGHRIHLVLNPGCFTTLDGATTLTGQTTFDFVMGDGAAADPITAIQIAPANGTLVHLGSISVVFDPAIKEIVDISGFSVTNENGHSLPILSVAIDEETPIHSLNVNIDPERTTLEGGTTYSLHIAPGAIMCGTITNETELVYGKWYVKPEPLALVMDPPHQRLVESISEVTIKAENGKRIVCTDTQCQDITVTGIMEDQNIVLATVKSITSDNTHLAFTIAFDEPITQRTLEAKGAHYDFVKMSVPAGLFKQNTKSFNEAFQVVWKIGTAPPLGNVTWSFTPSSGQKLMSLGTPLTVEKGEGEMSEVYILRFNITGQNAYMTISDASAIKIVENATGRTVKTFSRSDLKNENTNNFMLVMDSPITQSGQYSLVIPADHVNYYSDAEHYTEPQHPLTDIVATWTVDNPSEPLLGDANGDGNISIGDVTITIDALLHPTTSSAIINNADCDNDGSITISDVEETKKKVLRTEE